nr:PREDICTED: uncharacterized protein LOC109030988 [Bemisia tabaci]
MQRAERNDHKEWPSLPLKLLAGCVTFPFSLVSSRWKSDVEPHSESRGPKNTSHHDRDFQYRRHYRVAPRHKRPDSSQTACKPRVHKERGGKEDYEEDEPYAKARRSGIPRTPKSTEGPSKSSPALRERRMRRSEHQTPCCDPAEAINKASLQQVGRRVDASMSFNKNSMCRDCIEKYEQGIRMNYVRNLTILWFPPNFSQSKFGDRRAGSNACTLICILVSYKVHKTGLKLPNIRMQEAWEPLMNILAESIVEGNTIHERLRKENKLVEDNLTVPEAIHATRHHVERVTEWESTIISSRMKTSLFDYLSNKVMAWYDTVLSQKGSDLYVIVISLNRSVVLLFQKESETVTLVDSHSHYPHGAAIAQVPFKKLRELCNWYACLLRDSAEKPIKQYELSYLYFPDMNH